MVDAASCRDTDDHHEISSHFKDWRSHYLITPVTYLQHTYPALIMMLEVIASWEMFRTQRKAE